MLESRYDQVKTKLGAAWSTLCARNGPDLALLWEEGSWGEGGQQTAFLNGACLFSVSRIGRSPGGAGQRDLISAVTLQGLLCVTLGEIPKAGNTPAPAAWQRGIPHCFQRKSTNPQGLARSGEWGQGGARAGFGRPKARCVAELCSLPAAGRVPGWLSRECLGAPPGSRPCGDTTGVSLTQTRAIDLVFSQDKQCLVSTFELCCIPH